MGLKQRVTDIATQTAIQVAQQMIEIRMKQLGGSLSNMGSVTKVNGTQVTISMPDGSEKTVTNAGGRIVGKGDAMITDGQNIAF